MGYDDPRWDELFRRLQAYKKKNGDCQVPGRYNKDPQLGRWVLWQRQLFKKGKLRTDRKKRLESLGMTWVVLKDHWQAMFQKLQDYHQENGNCLVPHLYPCLLYTSPSPRD